jgi:hypothetical protein
MSEPEINPMRDREIEALYHPTRRATTRHAEGTLTRIVEEQTAKIPSAVFFVISLGAMAASAAFELTGRTRWSRFFGMWVPSMLSMGIYNKIVKSADSA